MAKNRVDIEIQLKAAGAGRELKKFSQDASRGLKNVKDESKHAAKGLKETSDESKGLSSSFGKLKIAAAALAAAFVAFKGLQSVVSFLKDSGKAAEQEEWAMRGLHQVIVSMKRDVPGFEQSLLDLANALEVQTGYGNDAILTAVKFLSTYKEITNDVMPRALQLTLDIARGWGVDLRSAANMVGKAAMGMTGELRRYGITVDQDTYKSRGFLGVMEQIEEQVKGQAAAYRETSTGLKEFVQAVWGDVKKQFGYIVNQVLDPFRKATGEILAGLATKLQEWREGVDLKTWAVDTAQSFKEFATKLTSDLIPALDNLIPKLEHTLETVGANFDRISKAYDKVKSVVNVIKRMADIIMPERLTWEKDLEELKKGYDEKKEEIEAAPTEPQVDITEATKSTEELHAQWQKIKADMEKNPIHVRIVKETIYTGGGGETEYGYKHGGFIHKQAGGAIPGWGGGDRIPVLAEPGEFILRKEAVRALGTNVLNALNQGKSKGYFVLDHRFEEGKAFPLTVTMDEVGKAFIEYLEHGQKTKGHF